MIEKYSIHSKGIVWFKIYVVWGEILTRRYVFIDFVAPNLFESEIMVFEISDIQNVFEYQIMITLIFLL